MCSMTPEPGGPPANAGKVVLEERGCPSPISPPPRGLSGSLMRPLSHPPTLPPHKHSDNGLSMSLSAAPTEAKFSAPAESKVTVGNWPQPKPCPLPRPASAYSPPPQLDPDVILQLVWGGGQAGPMAGRAPCLAHSEVMPLCYWDSVCQALALRTLVLFFVSVVPLGSEMCRLAGSGREVLVLF